MERKSLSVGRRLENILDEAEKESLLKVTEAQRKAEGLLANARTEAEEKRARAQRGQGIDALVKEEEAKAKIEAEKVKTEYKKKADALRNSPKAKRAKAIEMVVKEVLPQ